MHHQFYNEDLSFKSTFVPMEISILMDNFISNSDKAGASMMYFKFQKKGRYLHLHIGDNGGGVPKKIDKDIFTRGFSTTSGSGIGLHHAQEILKSMGGSARFVGNNLRGMGKGACFEVVFK